MDKRLIHTLVRLFLGGSRRDENRVQKGGVGERVHCPRATVY